MSGLGYNLQIRLSCCTQIQLILCCDVGYISLPTNIFAQVVSPLIVGEARFGGRDAFGRSTRF